MSSPKTNTLYLEENTVRIVALQVVLAVITILLTGKYYFALLLTADFAIRAFTSLPSLLGSISRYIVTQLKLEPVRIFAAPKKFAAAVGTVFSLAVFLLFYFNLNTYAYIAGGVLAFFAFLEGAFKICVGCYVYDWFIVPFLKK